MFHKIYPLENVLMFCTVKLKNFEDLSNLNYPEGPEEGTKIFRPFGGLSRAKNGTIFCPKGGRSANLFVRKYFELYGILFFNFCF
jgi:hypothetical protein